MLTKVLTPGDEVLATLLSYKNRWIRVDLQETSHLFIYEGHALVNFGNQRF
jgi:hypothetical protein